MILLVTLLSTGSGESGCGGERVVGDLVEPLPLPTSVPPTTISFPLPVIAVKRRKMSRGGTPRSLSG